MKSEILPIAGDASFRKFYRHILNKKSRVIVLAKKEKYKNLIAYAIVNNFLRENKILSPKLHNLNLNKGIMIIEDFGNISFYDVLIKKKNKLETYKKLINLLLKIQKIKPKSKIKNIFKKPHLIEEYSIKHLFKESDLFFDWYLPLFLSKKKIFKYKN